MHGCLLGITKTLLSKWIGQKNRKEEYFVGGKVILYLEYLIFLSFLYKCLKSMLFYESGGQELKELKHTDLMSLQILSIVKDRMHSHFYIIFILLLCTKDFKLKHTLSGKPYFCMHLQIILIVIDKKYVPIAF